MRVRVVGALGIVVGACANPPSPPAPRVEVEAGVAVADAAPPPRADAGIVTREAANARVDVVIDRSFVLGENILVHYCLENTSDAPFSIQVGGDYRGATRALRYKVVVVDGQGRRLVDPDTTGFNFGGMGHAPNVLPHQRWCATLSLPRYARIEEAGTYDVYVTHDLGWPKDEAPVGRGTLHVTAPRDEGEAETIVARMERLPKDPNVSSGKRAEAWADFTMLRYPIYLAPLAKRARAGSVDAVSGIGNIPTREATRALLALVRAGPHDVANAASTWLAMRLPDPALEGKLEKRNPFDDERAEQRRWLVERSWDPALADEVRAQARAMLATGDDAAMRHGAFMIEAVGESADADDVAGALSRAIEKTRTTPREKGIYPTPRGACMELLRAARVLRERKMRPLAKPSTHGELAIWLLAVKAGERPAGWEDEYGLALEHAIPYVRQLALEAAPSPFPPRHVKSVERALASDDVDVKIAAAHVAGREKLVALKPGLLAMVRTTADAYAFRGAMEASRAVGLRSERFEAAAQRLGAGVGETEDALDVLLGMLEESNGRSGSGAKSSAAERKALEAKWLALLKAKRATIDADKRIPFDDPAVTRDLVPPGFTVHRQGKPNWP